MEKNQIKIREGDEIIVGDYYCGVIDIGYEINPIYMEYLKIFHGLHLKLRYKKEWLNVRFKPHSPLRLYCYAKPIPSWHRIR